VGNLNPVLIGIGALIFMWVVIFTVISHVGGWAALAGEYRSQETFTGTCWSFQSCQMRWMVGYNNCLKVGGDPRGLYMAISFPFVFLIGHPPLFVPWRDISYVRKKILWTQVVEFRLGRDLDIPLRIREPLAEKLRAAAGSSWPTEAVA
jgi:hypothetical protein